MTQPQAVIQLDINSIEPNPLQPRGAIVQDSLSELVDSIKIHGVLEPLVVAQTPAGYQLIAGERRWRASRLAGLTTVPVIVKKTTPRGMLEMAIVENVQRSDLNPIDRAKAFERLMFEFSLGSGDIAKRVSKSPAYVSNSLRLLKLPDALKDGLLSGHITEGHARALSAITDHKTMIEAYKMVLQESASVRRAEEISRRMKTTPKYISPDHVYSSVEIDNMQSQIQQSLGDRSLVKLKRTRRETRIQIVFKGSPEETQQMLDHVIKTLESEKSLLEIPNFKF